MTTLRTIELAGSFAEMGQCYGEQFRREIGELAAIRMARLAGFVRRYDPSRTVGRDEILAASRQTIGAHLQYDPAVWEEFEGIARGSGLAIEELLVANGYTDLRDYVAFGGRDAAGCSDAHLGECSGFLVPAGRSESKSPLIGQTWDMHADAAPFVILVRRRPLDAPATLGISTTGCLCLVGMNELGVSVGNNNLVPRDPRIGVNYLFTITSALRCSSAEEAAGRIEGTPRLSGHNFLVADGQAAINLEASGRRCFRSEAAGDDVFVHTNHYLAETLVELEVPRDLSGTRYRRQRLGENFRKLSGPISMDDCWRQLADDTRCGDGAVCNEDYEGVHSEVATLATIVQCPSQRRMYVCAGGARLGRRVELTL